uniref:Integrase n=2 Tax=Oryza sativa subsp. japonica TaxID=39947 RepID=Q10HK2_ORYSJ|nr:putative integrase [Oryza sativa Japonica Group]ABF97341.1 retrotransposon protein, putative, unclassified [Oryza sativa Japonica Group]
MQGIRRSKVPLKIKHFVYHVGRGGFLVPFSWLRGTGREERINASCVGFLKLLIMSCSIALLQNLLGSLHDNFAVTTLEAHSKEEKKSRMQSYIMAEDYDIWRKVSHPYVIPEEINTAALKTEFEQNCKARNILLSGISRSDYDRVAHLQTAHEIWIALSNFHQGTNNIKELRRDLLKKEYIKFEMKLGEALDDYLSRFNKILSDLRFVDSSYDANYPQFEISRHFLNGLDMSIWEMKVTSVQESVNMSTLTLDSLYTKLKTHEMNILSRRVDSKSSALVSSSSSLDVDASSSKSSILALFNATSDDQLEQFKEEDLALVANRIARAMNNVRFRKRGGPNHCFECGLIDHLRSHCPKLGRGKREDNDREKNNDNKPKGTFKGRKIKENLKKAFDQVYAAFEPLSDVDGDSGDEDKGKNISVVCFMARGESYSECEDNEKLKQPHDVLDCSTCTLYKKKLKVALGRVEYMEDVVKNNEVLSCSKCRKNKGVMVDCENCANLEKEVLYLKNSLQRFSEGVGARGGEILVKPDTNKTVFKSVGIMSTLSASSLKSNVMHAKPPVVACVAKSSDSTNVSNNREKYACSFCGKYGYIDGFCFRLAHKQKKEREVAFAKSKWQKSRFPSRKSVRPQWFPRSDRRPVRPAAEPRSDRTPVRLAVKRRSDRPPALMARKENMWIVDFGCSRHMTGNKNWFSSLTKASKTESIIFGDVFTSVVLATGLVKVNEKFELKNVALVEDLKYNLLSVSQIVDEDFEVHFKKTGSKVFDSCGDSVLNISRYGRVFKADFDNSVSPVITCLVAKFDKNVMFWHRRLGHVGFDHLTRLSGLDLARGLPKLKKDFDSLLHIDTVGPARVQSIGGKWYVLVIVDNFSRYSWVFFMATKDEAFQHFRGLFLRLDLEFPGSLKRIRSDNGGELKIASFEQFCNKRGLEHEFSSPRVPQQNGVVERKIRVLVEMARTMLGTLSQVQGEDGRIFEDESDDDNDEVGSADQTRRQAGERTTRSKVTTHDVYANSAFVASFEPKDVSHALTDESWINVMHEELENFERNKVWTLFEPPSGHNIIGTKWVFKNKQNKDGLIVRNKAILVAQGFTQVEGLDFDETFAPIARIEAIRLLLAFAASKGFKLYQMDVKSAFLNGFIQEKVYVKQPPGFENPDFPNHVFKLSKALYGLKQAPRPWYDRLKNFLLAKGFTMGKVDKTLFVLKHGDNQLFIQIYVDDIIFGCSTHALVVEFAETMRREFEMSMMGKLSYFLGLQIKQTPQGTFVHQTKYTKDLLRRFKMENCKPISTPIGSTAMLDPDEDGKAVDQKEYRSMIGSLLYLTASRPDIQFAIIWFLSTLKDYCLTFEKVPLFCDNNSAINIAKNPVQHSRTKHIDIRFHFLRDHIEKGDVELQFLDTKLQLADIFTKPLDSNCFVFLHGELGIFHPFGMI